MDQPNQAAAFYTTPAPLLFNWKAAAGGALMALAAQVVLTLLGVAIAATLTDTVSARFAVPAAGVFSASWSLVATVAAMFLGGAIAGLAARGTSNTNGVVEGLLVWSLATVAAVAFVSSGVAGLVGSSFAGTDVPPHATATLHGSMADAFKTARNQGLASSWSHAPSLWTMLTTTLFAAMASVVGAVLGMGARLDVVRWGRRASTDDVARPEARDRDALKEETAAPVEMPTMRPQEA